MNKNVLQYWPRPYAISTGVVPPMDIVLPTDSTTAHGPYAPPPSQADAGSVWKVNSLEAVGPSTLAASADAAAGPELAGYAASVQQAAASTPATMVASTLSIIASINFTVQSLLKKLHWHFRQTIRLLISLKIFCVDICAHLYTTSWQRHTTRHTKLMVVYRTMFSSCSESLACTPTPCTVAI